MAEAATENAAIGPVERASEPRERLLERDKGARRGIGLRAATSFQAVVCEGPHVAHCRAVELSSTGVVIQRGRELSEREQKALFKLDLFLPYQSRPVRVLAKVARPLGQTSYAMRFVLVADVDRLTLMEHLDRELLASLKLLTEVDQATAANG